MAKRPVTMLTAMAGADFSYVPGDLVEVDERVAASWREAGIAGEPAAAHVAQHHLGLARDRIAELEAELADVGADRDALKGQAEQLGTQLAEISAEREGMVEQLAAAATKVAEVEPIAAKVPALEARVAELEKAAAKPAKATKPAA